MTAREAPRVPFAALLERGLVLPGARLYDAKRKVNALVRADGFPAWFAQVTPLEELGLLPIGSRPARRGLSGGRKCRI